MIKLVIITPALRADRFLGETLDHNRRLLDAGASFTQVIVGPDGLRGAVPSWAIWCPEARGTRGVFDAVGQGFEFAISELRATHLSYINSDDLLFPPFTETIANAQKYPESIVVGRVRWIGSEGQDFGLVPHWPTTWLASVLFEARKPPFTQQGVIIPAVQWRRLGGFSSDYRYIADSVLWHSALTAQIPFRFSRRVVAGYRLRAGQLSSNRAAVDAEERRWCDTLPRRSRSLGMQMLAKMLMSLLNSEVYLRRVLRGHKLKPAEAMRTGTF